MNKLLLMLFVVMLGSYTNVVISKPEKCTDSELGIINWEPYYNDILNMSEEEFKKKYNQFTLGSLGKRLYRMELRNAKTWAEKCG
jgi:hypothetical protein